MGIVKLVPSLLLMLRGLKLQEVLATTCLLAAPLTLVIAIMEMAAYSGNVDEATKANVITAGIMASLLYPSLARKLLKTPAPASTDEHDHAAK